MDLHIFADPNLDPGSQNVVNPRDLDPDSDPKHLMGYFNEDLKNAYTN